MLSKCSSIMTIFVSHHNTIQLNERSPEQFETIKHMNIRRPNAMETLENLL